MHDTNYDSKAFWLSVSGFFAVSIVGTLAHFLYNLSGKNFVVGLFTPISEAPFEHLKLLFFPFILWSLLEYFIYGKFVRGFWFAKALSVTIGIVFTIGTFYLYSSIIGHHVLAVDILLFLISVLMAFGFSLLAILSEKLQNEKWNWIGISILIFEALIFWIVTIVNL